MLDEGLPAGATLPVCICDISLDPVQMYPYCLPVIFLHLNSFGFTMSKSRKLEKVVIIVGSPDNPYGKIIRTERRLGSGDRRKFNTYIADDRRAAVADRRDYNRFLQPR